MMGRCKNYLIALELLTCKTLSFIHHCELPLGNGNHYNGISKLNKKEAVNA